MQAQPRQKAQPTITVLGGTGPFGAPYVNGFLRCGFIVRILARSPLTVQQRFPGARVISGTMMNPADVVQAMSGAASAFLMTPVGGNDDIEIELRAARSVLSAARAVRLPHLIYLSLLQPSVPTGVPVIDVKGEIEALIADSGVPWSGLRTGCYMGAWFKFFFSYKKIGFCLYPIWKDHAFSFTAQQDVVQIVDALVKANRILCDALDIIDPTPRTLSDVVNAYAARHRCQVLTPGKWLLPMLRLLKPVLFRWAYPEGASRIPIFAYFNRNDWIGDSEKMSLLFPEFSPTTIETFLSSRTLERIGAGAGSASADI